MVILVRQGFTDGWQSQSVELAPFAHQVGGHVGVFALDKNTVCKPQNLREYHFYQHLPEGLDKFVPKFKGVADVIVKEEREGYLNLVAYPSTVREPKSDYKVDGGDSGQGEGEDIPSQSFVCLSQPRLQPQYRIKLSSGGHLSINQDTDSDDIFEDKSSDSSCGRFGCNPWSMYCHREQIAKMQRDQSAVKTHKFVLLEDVTQQFEHPCILDLKIGVRSYGEDASEEKIKSHTAKVEGTTSAKLGIRVCGMQIYKPDRGLFICRNKYYGRHLTEDGLCRTVREFLVNSKKHGSEVASVMMETIKELIVTISKLDSYRFYGSSLLLIYEGLNECCPVPPDDGCPVPPVGQFCNEERLDNTVNTQTDVIISPKKLFSTRYKEVDLVMEPGHTESPSTSSNSDCRLSDRDTEQSGANEQVWKGNFHLKDYNHHPTNSNGSKQDFDPSKGPPVYWSEDQAHESMHLEATPVEEKTIQNHNDHHRWSRESTNKKWDKISDKHQTGSCMPRVHIKMIDFAHTESKGDASGKSGVGTGKGSKGAATQEGPDSGFIYGLENLFRIFGDIRAEYDATQK